MDPHEVFCLNLECPARGQMGRGNVRVLSQQEQRYECSLCGQTFSVRKGTPFYRCHVAPAIILQVLILVAHGCPIPAIQPAFGFQPRTVRRWVEVSGEHCEPIHQHEVVVPRKLGQVQADELRAKTQSGIFWLAMAIAVPTRLWLGGVVSAQRDGKLIQRLANMVRGCAVAGRLLVAMDGLAAYVTAFRRALREPLRTGQPCRPRLIPWKGIVLGQVIKKKAAGHLVAIERRLVEGNERALKRLLEATQGGGVLNTAYIERLNGTFRHRLSVLARRTRGPARRSEWLRASLYLVGTVYNFCTEHASLTQRDGRRRTPAMAAGITDHCWSMAELLWRRVPPPPWRPPKRRGKPSRALQELVQRWAS
jgi:transposase-like protein